MRVQLTLCLRVQACYLEPVELHCRHHSLQMAGLEGIGKVIFALATGDGPRRKDLRLGYAPGTYPRQCTLAAAGGKNAVLRINMFPKVIYGHSQVRASCVWQRLE